MTSRSPPAEPAATFPVHALSADTWPAFEALASRHNGVWNGCWCTWFHSRELLRPGESGREFKQRLVKEGKAHAALVFDGEGPDAEAIGWAEYGPPDQLPRIYHRKEIEARDEPAPDYRITCFFVDRRYRRKGVAAVALDGVVRLVAEAGGRVLESYPRDTNGARMSASFLYNATRSMFERAGFSYIAPKGQFNCIMRLTVPGARRARSRGSNR